MIPKGHRKAPNFVSWLRTVEDSEALAYMNRNRRERILKVCRHMVTLAHHKSGTTTPGHDMLAEHAGCSMRSITADIRLLHDAGLLATVAPGRSAEFVPKASITAEGVKGTKWASKANPKAVTNERAVYVFIEPLTNWTLDVMGDDWNQPVDKAGDPATPRECFNPTHTRENDERQEGHGSAATEKPSEALSERGDHDLWADRSVPSYPRHATTSAQTKRGTRENELRAAVTLQRRAFTLRKISAKYLAYVCRPWFAAGWTVADLQEAFENRPDGGRVPHDWGTGIVNVGPWVRSMLNHWWAGDKPMYSPTELRAKRRAPIFAHTIPAELV